MREYIWKLRNLNWDYTSWEKVLVECLNKYLTIGDQSGRVDKVGTGTTTPETNRDTNILTSNIIIIKKFLESFKQNI